MTSREGTPIPAYVSPVRGSGLGSGGGCLAVFGLPFIAAGLFVLSIGFGYVEPQKPPAGAERWVLAATGLVFAGAGLFVSGLGVAGSLRLRAAQRRQLEHEGQPWLVDYSWDPAGFTTSPLGDFAKGVLFALFLGLFLSPFNFFVFFSDENAPFFAKAIVGFFDLFFLLVVVGLVQNALKSLKYGESRLRYAKLPFFPGETLDVTLEGADRLADAEAIEVAFRCVRQKQVRQGKSTTVDGYLLHEDKRRIKPSEAGLPAGRGARILQLGRPTADRYPLPLSFPIPADAEPTRLLGIATEGVFWEVHVKAAAPGLDYDEHFLVPVYGPA